MNRRPAAVIIAAVMAFAITACSLGTGDGSDTNGAMVLLSDSNKGWVDSDLSNSISPDDEYRINDDFAAAVNKQWKLHVGDAYSGIMQEVADAVLEKMKKAVTDESIQGKEAEVLRKYYALSSDWEYRNSQGLEPLKPYIADIESIGNMDDLYAFFGDLDRNPLGLAPFSVTVLDYYHTEQFPDTNLILIETPTLSLKDETGVTYYDMLSSSTALDYFEGVEGKALYMLKQMGYSDRDATKIFRRCLNWEKKVARSGTETKYLNPDKSAVDREKAGAIAGSFPLNDLLNKWGFQNADFVIIPDRMASRLPSLCKESDLEDIKDYLIVNYCLQSARFLDRTTEDKMSELSISRVQKPMDYGMSEQQKEDELQFSYYIGTTSMLGALNKTYVENYFDDTTISELKSITNDIIDAYRDIFPNESWLSEEGKDRCLEKLDSIRIHIAYQSFEVLDYSVAPFASKDEGGSFLEAYFATKRYDMYHKVKLSEMKFSRDYWDPIDQMTSTTQTNAFYDPSTNGIFICAGICEPNSYSPDMSYEEKLAGLGTIIGHEITHGFDRNGALYDKDGMTNSWMPYEDQIAFSDLNDKVAAYYSSLSPYPGSGPYNGQKLTTEATADMGGLRSTLHLAAKDPDFDYDLYFRSYADLWKANYLLETERFFFMSDIHPLCFYRINVGVQQFEEFYETYGIQEGDGMYLDPEKRIAVW